MNRKEVKLSLSLSLSLSFSLSQGLFRNVREGRKMLCKSEESGERAKQQDAKRETAVSQELTGRGRVRPARARALPRSLAAINSVIIPSRKLPN